MKNISVTFINKQYQNRQQLFLQDPKSDLLAILRQKVYPLHKKFLTGVEYFHNTQTSEEKIQILDEKINQKWFEATAGYFYGFPLGFSRTWEIQELYCTLAILKIPSLIKIVEADIQNNFDQYGFFLLVNIAFKFKIKWLRIQCEEELALMNFQQLNYNRYDLFQTGMETFSQILKLHELLKVNQNIIGLNESIIKQICKQYCKTNKIPLNEMDKLLEFEDLTNINTNQKTEDMQTTTRKRNNSQHENIIKHEENAENLIKSVNTNKEISYADMGKGISVSTGTVAGVDGSNEDNKNVQLQKLKLINQEIQEKNYEMLEEINRVKININKSEDQSEILQIDNIDERFKNFQKSCKEQDQKFMKLKAQMQKLKPALKPSFEQSRSKSSGTKSQESQQRKQKKTGMVDIPKLRKD